MPKGEGEEDNVVIEEFYTSEKTKSPLYNTLNFSRINYSDGVKLAGSRFIVFKDNVARSHRYLLNSALDYFADLGYIEHYVPNLVKRDILQGTGQYPKFADDVYRIVNEDLYLIPTGEVPLTNLYKNHLFKTPEECDVKLMTHTPCFRKEIGNYGKDNKDILRLHQFEKVELVRITTPEKGFDVFNQFVDDIVSYIKTFKIPFRVVELCSGDIGFSGHKAVDIEMWFPSEQKYREIASITWCSDFQARRMKTRYKTKTGKNELVHTMNGTGLAVGRLLAAIIEHEIEVFN